jgi:gamma-glutamylcyclotransferase (GGCT)/AIG2-like uncharacterized protein YtfP
MAPQAMAATVAQLEPLGEGWVSGTLYDLGTYPGAILDAGVEGLIYGTVMRLPDDPQVLRDLDAYEGFEADCPEASLFLRERVTVVMADGGRLTCWMYALHRLPEGAQVLANGRFRCEGIEGS